MFFHPIVLARLNAIGNFGSQEHHAATGALNDIPLIAPEEHFAFPVSAKRTGPDFHGWRICRCRRHEIEFCRKASPILSQLMSSLRAFRLPVILIIFEKTVVSSATIEALKTMSRFGGSS